MDEIIYNGVQMNIIGQKEFLRRLVKTPDGTTVLWWEWVIHVRGAVMNPRVLNYDASGNRQTGQWPALTDVALRQLLKQPRKKLVIKQGANTVLICPQDGYVTDAQNGPMPEVFDVVRDLGGRTWIVDFKVVCRVRECPETRIGAATTSASPLISNRWTKIADTDQDHFTTVTTVGECVFDSAVLTKLGTWPDQYRLDLMQPIPVNMKRENVHVEQVSDGTTYRYSFTDTEKPFNLGDNFTTRVECYQTEFYGKRSLLGAIVGQGLQQVPNIVGNAGQLNPGGMLNNALNGGFNAIQEQIPQFYSHILVRAWGHRATPKIALMNRAIGMAFERLKIGERSVEFIVSMDRVGKMVEVQLTTRTGPEELAVQMAESVVASLLPFFGGNAAQIPDGVKKVLGNLSGPESSPSNFYTDAQNVNAAAPPPNSNDTRGTWLGRLVAESLHNPCALPPQPPQNIQLLTDDKRIYQ